MDALLSVSAPLLSLLALPALTSYSTSLNLVFFYLTWSTLLLSHSPIKVEALGTLFVRLLFYLLPSYFFLAFDASVPSVSVATKEHGELGIATSTHHKRGRWQRIAALSTTNVLLSVALQTAIELLLTQFLHFRSALKISTTIPFPWGVVKDLLKGFAAREALSYSLHRFALHHRSSPIRALHTKYYHSLAAPYSIAAHYDHPLPYLVRVFLPTYLPAVLFRFHLLTYLLFLALVSLEETFAYSGYSVLPSGFVLGGMARRHERHLMARDGIEGNFAAYGVADLLGGTSLGRDVLEDLEDETERRDVEGKAKGKAREVGRKVKRGKEKVSRARDGE